MDDEKENLGLGSSIPEGYKWRDIVAVSYTHLHSITKAVLAPMKAVKKMLVSMKLHLDAYIDKLDNLAIDVRMDKEKHMENAKVQEQTEPERAEEMCIRDSCESVRIEI